MEVAELVRVNPGRVSRDLIADTIGDVHGRGLRALVQRTRERRVNGALEPCTAYGRDARDPQPDTEAPLYSTKAQRALEASVCDRATHLANRFGSNLIAASREHIMFASRVKTECVNLFETGFVNKCYAAIGSGGLIKTVSSSAGGSGVPFTKRCGLRAYAA